MTRMTLRALVTRVPKALPQMEATQPTLTPPNRMKVPTMKEAVRPQSPRCFGSWELTYFADDGRRNCLEVQAIESRPTLKPGTTGGGAEIESSAALGITVDVHLNFNIRPPDLIDQSSHNDRVINRREAFRIASTRSSSASILDAFARLQCLLIPQKSCSVIINTHAQTVSVIGARPASK